MQLKKIILAGGTGFLGQAIIQKFNNLNSEIIVFTRGASHQEKNIRYINWDGKTIGNWASSLENADVLINLTGKSVNCRYNEKNMAEIISSRVNATKILGEAIKNTQNPPKVWLNCAAATIYRNSDDKAADEYTGEYGTGFSVDVCKLWEQSFNETDTPKTRKVALRISMVLGNGGGVMPVMTKLVKAGLGGSQGSGKQYMSWIHEEDFLNSIVWLIENENTSGPYNITAPEPVTNKNFMHLMRKHLLKKIGLPATEWMVKIGAVLLQTEPELILKSRNVVPAKLLKEGFEFKFPTAEEAISNLCNA